jgi:hypothetical protein
MTFFHSIKTHCDQIWISRDKETTIIKLLDQQIQSKGFLPNVSEPRDNYGYPFVYQKEQTILHCRLVDSVFLSDPEALTRLFPHTIITDNIPIIPIQGQLINVLPEFWSIWQFDPVYQNRPASVGFNCFMNRIRGDRLKTFYELIRRNILNKGLVSFNCEQAEYMDQYEQAEFYNYWKEHDAGLNLVPYNTVEAHGGLEQCIIDSNISLVLETYTSDSHIAFSEKIFRALQLPRPWLLYCSPGAVEYLKQYGFDTLDDYVDHSYDQISTHSHRHLKILDQLEIFIDKKYTDKDYSRFDQAAIHNQQLIKKFALAWPKKLDSILEKIKQL